MEDRGNGLFDDGTCTYPRKFICKGILINRGKISGACSNNKVVNTSVLVAYATLEVGSLVTNKKLHILVPYNIKPFFTRNF